MLLQQRMSAHHRWSQRTREWFRPPPSPAPDPVQCHKPRTELATASVPRVPTLLRSCSMRRTPHIRRRARRAESAERRATTIQGVHRDCRKPHPRGRIAAAKHDEHASHPWEITISGWLWAHGSAARRLQRGELSMSLGPGFFWATPAVTDIIGHSKQPTAEDHKARENQRPARGVRTQRQHRSPQALPPWTGGPLADVGAFGTQHRRGARGRICDSRLTRQFNADRRRGV